MTHGACVKWAWDTCAPEEHYPGVLGPLLQYRDGNILGSMSSLCVLSHTVG